MSNLTCPGCGSVYPLAAVQKFDSFTCAVCHKTIIVPIAGPAPARAAAPEPPRAVQVPPPLQQAYAPPPTYVPPPQAVPPYMASQAQAPRQQAPRRASPATAAAGPNWPLIGTGIAVAAAAVVGTLLVANKSSSPDAPPTTQPSGTAPKAATPAAASASPKTDPEKDPGAWKGLPAAERADRTLKYLTAIDRRNGTSLSNAFTFFKAREEQDAVQKVVEMELARDPTSGWAHQARGDVMVQDKVERTIVECSRADEADTPAIQKLNNLRKDKKPETGSWWADAALQKEIDAILAEVRAEEKALQDPYEWAVAKWKIYQRRIEVMRDHPAISATVGPYLLFVQVKAPPGTPLESVPSGEMARAKGVLEHEKELFGAFYEGFHETFGKPLGLTKYDKSNVDHKTILKANIFADETTWELYHQRLGFDPGATNVVAYYDHDEPRFVVTFDPGSSEKSARYDELQCGVAGFQIQHFYTWDLTRKAEGRELSWSECRTRPLWLLWGLPDFFAPHRTEGTKTVWMQPSLDHMERLWAFSQAFAKKRWAMWSLDELLSIADKQQVDDQARRRVLPKPVKQLTEQQTADVALAVRACRPAFYAKAWSLVSFVWNQADATGKSVYREGFLRLLKDSFLVKQVTTAGGLQTRILTASDFRKALGLDTEDRYRAFEKEWLAWETSLVAKSQKPSWTATRDSWFAELGVK